MRILGFISMLAAVGLCMAGGEAADTSGPMVIHESDAAFEDVVENIKMAIEERGMLVSGTLHVSEMLNRTGPDLGYPEVFKQAESVEFCSASLSHQMIQAAPENVTICPFTISVYIRADDPERLHIAYRRPHLAGEAAAVTAAIYELLDGIVMQAKEF